jgi:NAD(P)H-nitrite reductase large subunit
MREDGVLRKLFLEDGRITGFQLAGDIRGAGVYRRLMLSHADVRGTAPAPARAPVRSAPVSIAMRAMAGVG